jgi:hypothetical protein
LRAAVESAPPLPEDLRRRLVELIRAMPATTSGGDERRMSKDPHGAGRYAEAVYDA